MFFVYIITYSKLGRIFCVFCFPPLYSKVAQQWNKKLIYKTPRERTNFAHLQNTCCIKYKERWNDIHFTRVGQRKKSESPTGIKSMTFRTQVGCSNHVVRADRCTEGHTFDSCQRLRIFFFLSSAHDTMHIMFPDFITELTNLPSFFLYLSYKAVFNWVSKVISQLL